VINPPGRTHQEEPTRKNPPGRTHQEEPTKKILDLFRRSSKKTSAIFCDFLQLRTFSSGPSAQGLQDLRLSQLGQNL